jgi:arylsulfatase A-like enzyme
MRAFAWHGETEQHQRRLALLGSLAMLLAGFVAASLALGPDLVRRIARPENVALAELLLHLGLILVALVLWPFARVVCSGPLRLAARIPGLRWLVAKTGRLGALGLAVALVAFVIWIVVQREFIARFVPWKEAIGVAIAFLLALPLGWLLGRAARSRRAIRLSVLMIWLITLVTLGVTFWVGLGIPLTAGRARAVMVEDSLTGRLGFALYRLLTDVDRDGAVAGFSGGDCAPLDGRVNPSAVDVPSNGIDENCDGDDLVLSSLTELSGRADYAVPADWPKKPSILLITIDALAARHLKSFGGERETAPTIDRLAREGIAFQSCFAQGPSTRLSFPSIFTSRFDSEIAIDATRHYPFPIQPENQTLAELMAGAGYRTAAVVPNEYFRPAAWKGLTQGFARVDSDASRYWKRGFNADRVTDAAIRQLEPGNARPLFMWVHYFDPHEPHIQPPDTPVFGKERKDKYDAKVAWVDRHVGRLVAEARRVLGEDLLTIVSADHGYAFDAAHTKAGYGYDLSTVVMHVPLVFHARFLKPNRNELIVSTMDITPTLANLLGLGRAHRFRGFSLIPALSGADERRPQLVFHQAFLGESIAAKKDPLWLVGVRTPKYSMTLDRTSGRVTAFEWPTDYEEENDLWPSQGRDEELRALKDTLDAFVFASKSNLLR